MLPSLKKLRKFLKPVSFSILRQVPPEGLTVVRVDVVGWDWLPSRKQAERVLASGFGGQVRGLVAVFGLTFSTRVCWDKGYINILLA